MDWNDLLTALALVLVIEGIIPFISPLSAKRLVLFFGQMSDNKLRRVGAASMAVGLMVLWLVR